MLHVYAPALLLRAPDAFCRATCSGASALAGLNGIAKINVDVSVSIETQDPF